MNQARHIEVIARIGERAFFVKHSYTRVKCPDCGGEGTRQEGSVKWRCARCEGGGDISGRRWVVGRGKIKGIRISEHGTSYESRDHGAPSAHVFRLKPDAVRCCQALNADDGVAA